MFFMCFSVVLSCLVFVQKKQKKTKKLFLNLGFFQPWTRCLHFTAGCTTGWVNYANEPSRAAHARSSQDAYDGIRLMRRKAAVWTADDVARLIELKKNSY